MCPCSFLSFPKCQGVWLTCGITDGPVERIPCQLFFFLFHLFRMRVRPVIDVGNKNKIAKAMSSTQSKSKDQPHSKHKNPVIITL